jgi:pimeloyl-ACP methyl ester carboxylesterase
MAVGTAVPPKAPIPRTKAGWRDRLRRLLLAIGTLFLLLLAAGLIYQTMGAAQDRRTFTPPGRLVDVGGHRLHIHCIGQGSPTVVLETLSGGTSSYWAWVQPEIARTNRVCAYDRAGRGWSDAGPHAPALWQTATDLHTLLVNAGESAPYVLAGHSIGGLYVRAFAHRWPEEVAGLVLVDASHPDQWERLPTMAAENQSYLQMSSIFPPLARLGVFRLYFATGNELDFADLPTRAHDEVVAFWSSPEYFVSQRAEVIAAPQIFAESRALPGLGDLPLAVVTAGTGASDHWLELQDELAALSSNSTHVNIAEATHASLAFHPEHARETSQAILDVIARAR